MSLSPQTHRDWSARFADLLQRHFRQRLVSVVLYGSVAAGREQPDSDIDLLIVMEGITEGRYGRRELLDPVYKEWDAITRGKTVPFLAPLIKTPEEARRLSPIYFDMVDRRILLFDRDHFMENVLADVGGRLARLGARRRRMGKIEYWDLKPNYKPGEIFEI